MPKTTTKEEKKVKADAPEKKKRTKKEKDPNKPKRCVSCPIVAYTALSFRCAITTPFTHHMFSSQIPEAVVDDVKCGTSSFITRSALSAYMFFVQDYRDRIKAENPDVSFGEVGKLLGQKWKEMSTSEKKVSIRNAECVSKDIWEMSSRQGFFSFSNMKMLRRKTRLEL